MGPGLRRDDTEFVLPLVSHTSAFSRHLLPEFCISLRPLLEQRAQGKPGADCTHGSRATNGVLASLSFRDLGRATLPA